MRHDIELQVQVQQHVDITPQWYPLDIGNGNTLTLDYVSNLLSDLSQINSSRSFTVKLPRTRRNDAAFDLAVVPQHESQRPYRYLPCRVFVDGIDVAGEAFMYLVGSEAATYNAVIVFGLMQEYKAWTDAGKGLKELQDSGQSVIWNWQAAYIFTPLPGSVHSIYDYPPIWFGDDANVNTYTPANGLGRLMYYGIYNPGFERTDTLVDYANVHPFVTVRELLERIISENSLNFILPSSVLLDMENLAIVLTSVSGNTAQGKPNVDNNAATGHPYTIRLSSALKFGWNIICTTIGDCFQNGNPYGVKGKILHKGDADAVDLIITMLLTDKSSFPYNGGHQSASYIINAAGHMEYFNLCVYVYATQQTITLTPTYTAIGIRWQGAIRIPCWDAHEGDAIADIWIDNDIGICTYCEGAFNDYWMHGRDTWDGLFTWSACSVGVRYYTDSIIYPHPNFRCFSNLPDIKQLDFVKMVCHLYGLFPCQRENAVDFVQIEDLEANKAYAYNWSDYLLEDDPDAPHHTDWHMTDLARRNRVSYKEDEKDIVIDEAFLTVDDDTLDRDGDFFTIPLAATYDDMIDQYSITPEYDDSTNPPTLTGYKAEFTECEHRLMRVVEWYNGEKNVTRLAFQNLSSAQIIAERYGAYQSYVNQPRIVTERLRVPLADMRTLDYSKPVFLSKYGKHFAIIDIKWTVTQDTCEVKFLML